jgi:Spy/CpxP family protein refolding chaperone
MKKTIIIGLCLTMALALIATAALARGPGFGRGFGPGFMPGSGSGYPAIPDLTAEQSARIKALQEAFLQETEPLQKEMTAKAAELRGLRFAPGADAAAAKARQEVLFALRTQLQERGNNLRVEVQKVLTPEQSVQFPAFGPGRGFGPVAGFGPPMRGPRGRW